MIKTLGNPEDKRYTGDTAGLLELLALDMRLTYSVCDMVSDVVYAPRSKRDPMPWVQVGGLESRLRSGEIVAVEVPEGDDGMKCGNRIKYGRNVCAREHGHVGPHRDTAMSEAHSFRWFDNEGTPADETEKQATARYVVQPYDRRSRFAVYDTVTELDVDNYSSRYAAQDRADRLNAPAKVQDAQLAGERLFKVCVHGRRLYKTLRAKSVPVCAEGATYGVWDDNDAGFVHVVDCAQDAVTWATEQMDDEPDYELEILAVCREHTDQPANGCEECDA